MTKTLTIEELEQYLEPEYAALRVPPAPALPDGYETPPGDAAGAEVCAALRRNISRLQAQRCADGDEAGAGRLEVFHKQVENWLATGVWDATT